MIRYLCDRCGRDVTGNRRGAYSLTIEAERLLRYYTRVTLCGDCIKQLQQWLKQTEVPFERADSDT